MLPCAHLRKRRELQIGGRFTDRVYANNNAAVRSVGIHSSRARKGYRRTRIGAVKARTSRLGRSLNDSPDNGDECGHNSPRLRNVCAPRSRLYWQRASTSTSDPLSYFLSLISPRASLQNVCLAKSREKWTGKWNGKLDESTRSGHGE